MLTVNYSCIVARKQSLFQHMLSTLSKCTQQAKAYSTATVGSLHAVKWIHVKVRVNWPIYICMVFWVIRVGERQTNSVFYLCWHWRINLSWPDMKDTFVLLHLKLTRLEEFCLEDLESSVLYSPQQHVFKKRENEKHKMHVCACC